MIGLCAFLLFLVGFLSGGQGWIAAAVVFFFANFALARLFPKPESSPAFEDKGTAKTLRLYDWALLSYAFILGLGFNWLWAFLWFSRRYAFFSTRIIAVTGFVMAVWAVIALIVAQLTGRNWRTAVLVFATGPGLLASVFLPLR